KSEQFQPAIGANIDPAGLITRQTPQHLFVANYNGILRANLFAEAQYSEKKFAFQNAGGTSTNLVDSPIQTLGIRSPAGLFYNAPYFDANDPEVRNNRQTT